MQYTEQIVKQGVIKRIKTVTSGSTLNSVDEGLKVEKHITTK